MRPALLIALLVASLLPVGAQADAFRCGSKLASEGDTLGQVIDKCGPPSEVQHKTILRPAVIWRDGRPYRVGDGEVEVAVEIWTYNQGSSKLMRRLRFEDGELVAVETLGRGY